MRGDGIGEECQGRTGHLFPGGWKKKGKKRERRKREGRKREGRKIFSGGSEGGAANGRMANDILHRFLPIVENFHLMLEQQLFCSRMNAYFSLHALILSLIEYPVLAIGELSIIITPISPGPAQKASNSARLPVCRVKPTPRSRFLLRVSDGELPSNVQCCNFFLYAQAFNCRNTVFLCKILATSELALMAQAI